MQQLPICLCEMLCSLLIELVAHSCTSCGVVQDEEVPLCRLLMIHLWQTLTAVSSSMHAYWMLYSLSWNVVAIKQKIKSLYFYANVYLTSFSPVYVWRIITVGRSGGASSHFHSQCTVNLLTNDKGMQKRWCQPPSIFRFLLLTFTVTISGVALFFLL